MNNELKDFILISAVIYKLTLPYTPESNGIVDLMNQTIDMIA
jgi:hypothetical protein